MRLVNMSEIAEIPQNRKAGVAGFFRVKLHPEQMIALHSCRKSAAILTACDRGLVDRSTKGMRKVDKR